MDAKIGDRRDMMGEKENIFKNKTVAISQDSKERNNLTKYQGEQ